MQNCRRKLTVRYGKVFSYFSKFPTRVSALDQCPHWGICLQATVILPATVYGSVPG